MADLKQSKAPDVGYGDLWASTDRPAIEASERLKAMCLESAQYLDGNLEARISEDPDAAFWESYLCKVLLDVGLPVTPRPHRRHQSKGPDLQLGDVDAWCEAIATRPGTGCDAVPSPPETGVSEVPDKALKVRLANALEEKRRKYEKYEATGLVGRDEPRIVAINAGAIPSATKEFDPPRIVRTVFPVGWPIARWDPATDRLSDGGHEYRPQELKHAGSAVPVDVFLSRACEAVSAIVYCATTLYSIPKRIGAEFVLVHNAAPQVPLPRGWLGRGREYWAKGSVIVCRDHNIEAA